MTSHQQIVDNVVRGVKENVVQDVIQSVENNLDFVAEVRTSRAGDRLSVNEQRQLRSAILDDLTARLEHLKVCLQQEQLIPPRREPEPQSDSEEPQAEQEPYPTVRRAVDKAPAKRKKKRRHRREQHDNHRATAATLQSLAASSSSRP
mmetsp:Transcript_47145/g.93827  ORF Transcript_47145/g.93827 Transcript_47145/m.93827 type:complete len:148 (+) Transcript_47145:2-445(+)